MIFLFICAFLSKKGMTFSKPISFVQGKKKTSDIDILIELKNEKNSFIRIMESYFNYKREKYPNNLVNILKVDFAQEPYIYQFLQ